MFELQLLVPRSPLAYQAPVSSAGAPLQCGGRWVCQIRSKSTCENGIGGWGPQKRSQTSSARSVGTTAGVVAFRSTHSLGARLNTTSDYPLHHSHRSKLTNSIELGSDAPDQNSGLLLFLTKWNPCIVVGHDRQNLMRTPHTHLWEGSFMGRV